MKMKTPSKGKKHPVQKLKDGGKVMPFMKGKMPADKADKAKKDMK